MEGFKIINKKILFSVLIIFLALFIVDSVSASEVNETQEVLSIVDDSVSLDDIDSSDYNDSVLSDSKDNNRNLLGGSVGDGDLLGDNPAGTFAELQAIIDDARSFATIYLDRDYVGNGAYITIDKPLTIVGNGHTLDANGKSCVVWISYDLVTLRDLNIVNGKQPSGGGVYIASRDCVIDNCTFRNDVATGYGGGAIATDGNNLKVTNCNFYSCTCTSTTSGQANGGAILFRETKVGDSSTKNNLNAGNVSGCYFESCTTPRDAGAIKAWCKNLIIDNNTFVGCSGTNGWGGSVMIHSSDNSRITNCNFINSTNKAKGGSLALYNSPNVVIDNCDFINSKCTYSNSGSDIYDGGHGGSIYIAGSSSGVTVSNCDFNNSFSTNFGGAVYTQSDKTSIVNCSAYNCYSFRGGVFFISADDCEILNCMGSDNTCGHGTVIYGRDIPNRQSDGKIYRLTVDGCSFYNNYASVSEAAIYAEAANCVFKNCVLVNNTSTAYTLKFSSGKNNVVENCIIYNNSDSRLIASGDTATIIANNNWFGNTENDYSVSPQTAGSGITLNQWYFLTLAANQTIVAQNQTVLMEIGLNGLYNSKTGKVSKSTDYDLPFDMVPERFLPTEFDIGVDNGVTNQSSILFSHVSDSFLYTPEHTDSGTVTLLNSLGMRLSDTVIVIRNGTFTDLYNRINYTEEGSVLDLPYNFTYDEDYDNVWLNNLYGLSNVSGGLPLDKNLTINGNDNTIDASGKVDIFNVTGDITLENVKLNNGTINNNGNLTLQNVQHRGTTYSIINNANLVLQKDYDLRTIKNNGLITGPFTITILNNQTIIRAINDCIVNINATTDFGVDIEGGKLTFINV